MVEVTQNLGLFTVPSSRENIIPAKAYFKCTCPALPLKLIRAKQILIALQCLASMQTHPYDTEVTQKLSDLTCVEESAQTARDVARRKE